MLFLLRKIRRKLLVKNKITIYLLYAVGEIFLVVIGILIAVSIDNWNQDKQERKEEKELLLSLLKESEANLASTQNLWTYHRKMDPHIRMLLDHIGQKNITLNTELRESMIFLNYDLGATIDLAVGSYAVSTGKLSILKNEDLRKSIQALIPRMENFLSSRVKMQNWVDEMFNESTIRRYFRIREVRYPSGYGDAGPSKFPSSMMPLLEEPVFETYLENLRLANAEVLAACIRSNFNLEPAIREIKKELVAFDVVFDQSVPEVEPQIFPFNDFDRPKFYYFAWSSNRVPRWRDLTDSLHIQFYDGNRWASWQATRLGSYSDYSKYSGLKLELRSEGNAGIILFGLKDINDSDAESGHEIELNLTEEWQTFTIPFSQYSEFDPTRFHYLKLIHLNQAPITVLVKRIEFIQ